MAVKKLIEVALPLEAINAESAREKSIRHGHPSTLHLWWARRPLATARAVIWSSLVDDPSSHPDRFPTEEAQKAERERLFDILTRLVKWENSNDENILAEAKAEIRKSCGDEKLTLLDPFAGGGAIPLEAQRLGLEAHAHDLNPVAVMINKAMIEIPPKFANCRPVNPEWRTRLAGKTTASKGAEGLAEDVKYYGEWMKEEAFKRIGHLYPKVKTPEGKEATVIAWIWARTVKCPNPACGCEMPLVKSFDLSKKKGNESCIQVLLNNKEPLFKVNNFKSKIDGTIARNGGTCPFCKDSVDFQYIRKEASDNRMKTSMMAVVAEGGKGRLYLSPDDIQKEASNVNAPDKYPTGTLSGKARVNVGLYGINETAQLFTNRQLTALTTFSELVGEAQKKVEQDAITAGLPDDHIPLREGGTGARAYAEAIGVYLTFVVDRQCNYSSTLNTWGGEFIVQTFGRQALPMIWDFAETNPFSSSTGCLSNAIIWVTDCLKTFNEDILCIALQHDAQYDNKLRNVIVSTDPPYYDNIGYADLSDYFYIWMRQALKNTYPDLFSTMLVPKAEELVATPYRFDGNKEKAKEFFENGMYRTCCQINKYTRIDIPVTIYYAFKQSETEINDNSLATASSGWETMLNALINASFTICGTWPMRTERATGLKAAVNALASSIVLVCRKRPEDAQSTTRRDFLNALRRELIPAIHKLQSANIAPVDLAQSAIGPGIGVFSRYKSVLEADGKPMTVRTALQIINHELDALFNEQEGELDRESRFCIDLFSQFAFNNMKFGDADILARAKDTSVQKLSDIAVLSASKGYVRLKTREELPEKIDSSEECIWLLMQQLVYRMEKGGVQACANALCDMLGSNAENAKSLAYRMYTVCERKNWAQEGYEYNNLVVAWPDILVSAAELRAKRPMQVKMDI